MGRSLECAGDFQGKMFLTILPPFQIAIFPKGTFSLPFFLPLSPCGGSKVPLSPPLPRLEACCAVPGLLTCIGPCAADLHAWLSWGGSGMSCVKHVVSGTQCVNRLDLTGCLAWQSPLTPWFGHLLIRVIALTVCLAAFPRPALLIACCMRCTGVCRWLGGIQCVHAGSQKYIVYTRAVHGG